MSKRYFTTVGIRRLANDFTQINDLGYGLVANNAAFEQVSHLRTIVGYGVNNGSEIRGLNCSKWLW